MLGTDSTTPKSEKCKCGSDTARAFKFQAVHAFFGVSPRDPRIRVTSFHYNVIHEEGNSSNNVDGSQHHHSDVGMCGGSSIEIMCLSCISVYLDKEEKVTDCGVR